MGEGRKVKVLQRAVEEVSALEPEIEKLSDGALAAKTDEFRERLGAGETLDDIMPEAFAVVREASRRTLGLRPFDVQVMGGIVLHQGKIAEFLGLKVGLIQESMGFEERKEAYASDLTYGTNAQFGFDYLRDNIATSTDQLVQRELNYAIVDEVDSILIDEARTPLII